MDSPQNSHPITLKLNQQQLELMDRTIAQGVAPDRAALVLHALRAYAVAHRADAANAMTTPVAGDSQ